MPAPPEIVDLVGRFEQQLETYKSGSYYETQLRRDVIHEDENRIVGEGTAK